MVEPRSVEKRKLAAQWNSQLTCRAPLQGQFLSSKNKKKKHAEIDSNGDPNLKFNTRSKFSTLQLQRKLLTSWLQTRLKIKSLVQAAGIPKSNNKNEADSEKMAKPNPRREALQARVMKQVSEEVDFDSLAVQISAKSALLGLLQVYAENPKSNSMHIHKLESFVIANFSRLAYNKPGAHLIRTLMSKSKAFCEAVLSYSLKNFKAMATNDFACRVLRAIMRQNASFRTHAVKYLRRDLDFCLDNFPSIFIVTEAIRMSQNLEEFDFLVEALEKNSNRVLSSRYFKRILVTFAEYCTPAQFQRVEIALSVESNIGRYLNDKFCTTILTIMMSRDSQWCFDILTKMAYSDPIQLLNSSKFEYLITRLLALLPQTAMKTLYSILHLIRDRAMEHMHTDKDYHSRLLFIGYSLLLAWKSCGSPQSDLSEIISWIRSVACHY